jgi:hypothetical protein
LFERVPGDRTLQRLEATEGRSGAASEGSFEVRLSETVLELRFSSLRKQGERWPRVCAPRASVEAALGFPASPEHV